MAIVKKPIFVELDRRREVRFNLLTEARIQGAKKLGSALWDVVGEYRDASGELKKKLNLNLENFSVYLWAALYEDAHRCGELLTVEDVGNLIDHHRKSNAAYDALSLALIGYYGDEDQAAGGESARA
jgi:hypothetical protein